jgi:cell division protein ZapA (FtsZ GTPase activity inhibitor)
MGSSKESVRVVIFGVEYSIKSDVDTEITKQVAQYVNSKIAQIHENTASRDNLKLVVLSALNITGELFEFKAKYDDSARKINQLEEKIAALTQKINVVLDN